MPEGSPRSAGAAWDAQNTWAQKNLSPDGYLRWLQNTPRPNATPTQSGTPTQGQPYQWSDGRWSTMPEPMVNWATGYQTGSGLTYSQIPYGSLMSQGMANLNSTQMGILIQAASNMAGYDARSNLASTLPPAWEYAVNRASTMGADPMEILAWVARNGLGARFGDNPFPQQDLSGSSSSSSGGGGGGGGGTMTVTTTNITNPDAAKRLVNQAMTSYLGREATAQEIKQFVKALNTEERANPTIQTMSSSGTSQSQVIEGGMDAAQFTQEYAQSRPDYAEYRAATDLMESFLGILQGPVR